MSISTEIPRDDVRILLGGDFSPSGSLVAKLRQGNSAASAMVGSLESLFAESDIRAVNLECPLTCCGVPAPKPSSHARAHPDVIGLLTHLGVDIVMLANNHIRDYGAEGVRDTLRYCAAKGIATVGAGMDLKQARQPAYIQRHNHIVAFVNVAEQEFNSASELEAGANPLEIINVIEDLKQARAHADHVVLVVHGGLEMTHYPSPGSVRLLRFFAEQGVVAVVRHHAHLVQGMEIWKGVPILYGLGNFLYESPGVSDRGWFEGGLARLTVTKDRVCHVEMVGIEQSRMGTTIRLLAGSEQEAFQARVASYSAVLSDPLKLDAIWRQQVASLAPEYFGYLMMPNYFLHRVARRLGLLQLVTPSRHRRLLFENFMKCEAHREVLRCVLEQYPD